MWQDQAPHGSGVIATPISCLLGMVGPWLRGLARFTNFVPLCVCAHLHTIINTFESKCLGLAVRMSELPRNFTPTHLGFWGSSLTDSSHKQTNTRHSLIFLAWSTLALHSRWARAQLALRSPHRTARTPRRPWRSPDGGSDSCVSRCACRSRPHPPAV